MSRTTKKQLRAEIDQLQRAVRGPVSEFLDAHAIIGYRAGSGELIHITTGATRAEQRAAEDAVLWAAAEILRVRKRRKD